MEDRLLLIKNLLLSGEATTQESIQQFLKQKKFKVNQSTVSRDLKRLGAIRALDQDGQAVYRLAESMNSAPIPQNLLGSLSSLVLGIEFNDYNIVLKTSPGSAALIARHIDSSRIDGVIGTIAGDDTIFIAVKKPIYTAKIVQLLKSGLGISGI